MARITEAIRSTKPVSFKGSDLFLITTVSDTTVWCNKHEYDPNAANVTYEVHKKDDTYTDKNGKELKYKQDGNKFIGYGQPSLEDKIALLTKYGLSPRL